MDLDRDPSRRRPPAERRRCDRVRAARWQNRLLAGGLRPRRAHSLSIRSRASGRSATVPGRTSQRARFLLPALVGGRRIAETANGGRAMPSKTAIVTGASSGIGLALARAFLARGYAVIGNSRSQSHLKKAQD